MRAYLTYYLLIGGIFLYFAVKSALLVGVYFLLRSAEVKARQRQEIQKAKIREMIQARVEARAKERDALARKLMLEMPHLTIRSATVRQNSIFEDTRHYY